MPGLNQPQAFGLLILYCIIYVLPLWSSPSTRASPNRSRDDPDAIRARIRAVSSSTTLCSLATLLILYAIAPDDESPWHVMGYWPLGLVPALKALFLTALLFAAPLFESLIVDGGWKDWTRLQPLTEVWNEWPMWRNLVAGPITEECLFRSAAVPLLLLASTSLSHVILLSPLVFGIAHVHHFYEFRITNPEVGLPVAIARSLIQLSYTSLFGIYATFLFIRTGSLFAVIIVHTFCNCMGLPRVWGRLEPWWMTPQELRSSGATVWTVGYYVLLFAGMAAWYRGLMPLTDNSVALAQF